MLRRDLLRSMLATPLAGWLRPCMPRAFAVGAPEEPNAAVLYRRAFAWGKGLSAEDRDRLRRAPTLAVDGRDFDVLIRQAGPALDAIREAASAGHCDWGLGTLKSEDLGKGPLDVLNIALVHVACLSARRHAAKGREHEALDDVFAGLALAHRVGTGGVLFARILECAGERPAFRTLGRILPDLKPEALDDLSRRLNALPPPEPASAAIGPESRFILGTLRARIKALGPVIRVEDWDELGYASEETAALRRLTGNDRDKLLVHLDSTGPAFAELARRLDLPRPGCRAAVDDFARAERPAQPVVASLAENAWGVRHVVDRMRALRAMLRAGLALVQNGEPGFRAVIDPYSNGPFGLERSGKGHLIRSALNDEGRPPEVTLGLGETT